MQLALNARAALCVNELVAEREVHRVEVAEIAGGRVIDAGVKAQGGLETGLALARICMAGLGNIALVPANPIFGAGAAIQVATDHPVAACMASQYAGWQLAQGKYFAMGSGPMRAARGKEPLFDDIGHRERAEQVVGVLEGKLPPEEIVQKIATECGVSPAQVTLVVARTASLAGTVQVVARTVETALHKLHELKYPLDRVVSGFGVAPLPPVAKDDMAGIGRTNDAVLYGGEVTLWLKDDNDDTLQELAAKLPSSASRDFGRPFGEIFAAAGYDFYKIDPHLFSPAVVTLINLKTGRTFRGGELRPDVLRASFGS